MTTAATFSGISLQTVVDQETGVTLADWLKSEMEVLLLRQGAITGQSQAEVEAMFA